MVYLGRRFPQPRPVVVVDREVYRGEYVDEFSLRSRGKLPNL